MSAVERFIRNYQQAFGIEVAQIWLMFFLLAVVQGSVAALAFKNSGASPAEINGLVEAYELVGYLCVFKIAGQPALQAIKDEVGRQWGDQIRRTLGLEVES